MNAETTQVAWDMVTLLRKEMSCPKTAREAESQLTPESTKHEHKELFVWVPEVSGYFVACMASPSTD